MFRPPLKSARFLVAALCVSVVCAMRVDGQRLAPAAESEQCHGDRISELSFLATQRDITDRFGSLGRAINATVRTVQPATVSNVIERFMLLKPGDACDEGRRVESERILRTQPYISDAVIRVRRADSGTVRLEVETIDEYVLFAEVGGLSGPPYGLEVGTGNFLGRGKSVSGLVEYGRGGTVGGGVLFTDYQAFGRPLTLRLDGGRRPLSNSWSVNLAHPFLTNFQATAWQVGTRYSRGYYTFRDPVVHDVSIDYERRSWVAGGVKRVGELSSLRLGAFVTGESTAPLRTVAIRDSGIIPMTAPVLLQRYKAFESTRGGLAAAYRAYHLVQVRGLEALSAPQDVQMGVQVVGIGLRTLDMFAHDTPDWLANVGVYAAAGTPSSIFQLSWGSETRFPIGTSAPAQSTGSGRVAWSGKTSIGHTTTIGLELAGESNARVPLQLTFRGDDGLLGYRSFEEGGSRRIVGRLEDRHTVPSPLKSVELAVAGLFEGGRIEAGDAAYGASTPWRYSAGVAIIAALPAGSKQSLRFDFGVPVSPGIERTLELRISYSDRTSYFWREPNAIWSAREASSVGVP